MKRKQILLLGGLYFILCLLVQIVLLWGFHKRWDMLWLIGLALIVFAYAGASHISMDFLQGSAYQLTRRSHERMQQNEFVSVPFLPYLFAALPLAINLVIAYQFFH